MKIVLLTVPSHTGLYTINWTIVKNYLSVYFSADNVSKQEIIIIIITIILIIIKTKISVRIKIKTSFTICIDQRELRCLLIKHTQILSLSLLPSMHWFTGTDKK